MIYAVAVIVALFSYLLGSINTSIILSKAVYGDDIRLSGSGNAGATNMLRTHGKGIAAATLICDILKGTIAVTLAAWADLILTENNVKSVLTVNEMYILGNLKYLAGICVAVGHDFPLFFGFKGGKGVATSLGVVLALNWKIGLVLLAVEIAVISVSRYVSLGSVTAAALYPFALFVYIIMSGGKPEECTGYLLMAFVLAVLLIIKHRTNIVKLKNGTENKIFAKKETENTPE